MVGQQASATSQQLGGADEQTKALAAASWQMAACQLYTLASQLKATLCHKRARSLARRPRKLLSRGSSARILFVIAAAANAAATTKGINSDQLWLSGLG